MYYQSREWEDEKQTLQALSDSSVKMREVAMWQVAITRDKQQWVEAAWSVLEVRETVAELKLTAIEARVKVVVDEVSTEANVPREANAAATTEAKTGAA